MPLESPSWGLEGEVVGPKTLADPTGSRELGRSRLCLEAPLTRSLTLLPDVPKLRHSGRRFAACVLAASKCVCMRAAGPRDPSAAVRWGGLYGRGLSSWSSVSQRRVWLSRPLERLRTHSQQRVLRVRIPEVGGGALQNLMMRPPVQGPPSGWEAAPTHFPPEPAQ